jgi:hypothetical protein
VVGWVCCIAVVTRDGDQETVTLPSEGSSPAQILGLLRMSQLITEQGIDVQPVGPHTDEED